MAWGEGGSLAVLAGAAITSLWLGTACTTPVTPEAGRYRHAKSGASVADPGSAWRPLELEGAALALRGPDDAAMTWIHVCREGLRESRWLARELVAGLEGVVLVESREAELLGRPGWVLHATARDGARAVRIHGRIRHDGRCHDDFVWVGPLEPADVPPEFEAFWRSFEPGGTSP